MIDAVAIVEAMHKAYPYRSPDYCRWRVAECLANKNEALVEWRRADLAVAWRRSRQSDPVFAAAYPLAPVESFRDLLRPLWSEQ